jgi:hypothetical protein
MRVINFCYHCGKRVIKRYFYHAWINKNKFGGKTKTSKQSLSMCHSDVSIIVSIFFALNNAIVLDRNHLEIMSFKVQDSANRICKNYFKSSS